MQQGAQEESSPAGPEPSPLISRGNLRRGLLDGEVIIVTDVGRGIGFETASALLWLRASVVIADGDDICVLYDLITSMATVYTSSWYKVEGGKTISIQTVFDPRAFGPSSSPDRPR